MKSHFLSGYLQSCDKSVSFLSSTNIIDALYRNGKHFFTFIVSAKKSFEVKWKLFFWTVRQGRKKFHSLLCFSLMLLDCEHVIYASAMWKIIFMQNRFLIKIDSSRFKCASEYLSLVVLQTHLDIFFLIIETYALRSFPSFTWKWIMNENRFTCRSYKR